MEQIVLNPNLSLLLSVLTTEEKGLLLDALLNGTEQHLSGQSISLYRYIMLEQQKIAARKQHMRQLGALGGASKKNAQASLVKRKEAKENTQYKNTNYTYILSEEASPEDAQPSPSFIPPAAEEVRAFAKKEGLNIDADTFVTFYESRGWQGGQSPIKNWKAAARLWHRRNASTTEDDDSSYWKELATRATLSQSPSTPKEEEQIPHSPPAPPAEISHFARFMQRIEEHDLTKEKKQ